MSYCRWSSLNFGCDLYVYEDVSGGWTCHVAGYRIVGEMPEVVWPADGDRSPEALDRFAATRRAQHEFIMAAEKAPIGLPHDGHTFNVPTAGEMAAWVERLVAMGYRAPAYVAEQLRAEQAEADA